MDESVTTTAVHNVAYGREDDFYAWATALFREAERSTDFLGGGILGSPEAGGEWHVIYRWVDQAAAEWWAETAAREGWMDLAESFAHPIQVQQITGLRAWFEKRAAAASPPPKWKMALVTLTAVFPPVLLFNLTLIPRLLGLPAVLRTLVLCVGVTAVVTWVMMPRLMLLLKGWLHPPAPEQSAGRSVMTPREYSSRGGYASTRDGYSSAGRAYAATASGSAPTRGATRGADTWDGDAVSVAERHAAARSIYASAEERYASAREDYGTVEEPYESTPAEVDFDRGIAASDRPAGRHSAADETLPRPILSPEPIMSPEPSWRAVPTAPSWSAAPVEPPQRPVEPPQRPVEPPQRVVPPTPSWPVPAMEPQRAMPVEPWRAAPVEPQRVVPPTPSWPVPAMEPQRAMPVAQPWRAVPLEPSRPITPPSMPMAAPPTTPIGQPWRTAPVEPSWRAAPVEPPQGMPVEPPRAAPVPPTRAASMPPPGVPIEPSWPAVVEEKPWWETSSEQPRVEQPPLEQEYRPQWREDPISEPEPPVLHVRPVLNLVRNPDDPDTPPPGIRRPSARGPRTQNLRRETG